MEYSRKALFDKMKAKAKSLAGGSDATGIGSSTWSKDEPLNADVQTGMRPLSRQARKDGGKVEGDEPERRSDKISRSIGVGIANRDVKEANEEREGKKHVGGMNKGGTAKAGGGAVDTSPRPKPRPKYLESDGAADADVGSAEQDGMPDDDGRKKGGAVKKNCGGSISQAGMDSGGREARASGGSVGKGKTNINIIINPSKPNSEPVGMPPRPPMVPPMGGPAPNAPPMGAGLSGAPASAMPAAGAPSPMQRPAMGISGASMPAGIMMGRKDGGKVNPDVHMTHGAGGGLGRLEKIRKYGDNA